jgi:hypothetical protein
VAWSQPDGANTTVYPTENTGPFTAYPVPGQMFAENSGMWFFGCGHSVMLPLVFRDYDNMLGESVAVICCPMCTFIQRYQSPYESIQDPFNFPIIIP